MMQTMRNSRPIETQHEASTVALAAKLPWMVEMLAPSSLKAAKRNARTHSEKQIELIANSILHFTLIKPVIIDNRGRIVAGHGVWLAAKKLGLKLIPVIRVSHLSEAQLRAYALADNQLATKSGWDRELLSLEFGDLQIALPEIGLDLTMLGFEVGEIDSVLEDFGDGTPDPADEIPEIEDGPAVSQPGDVFVLGRHRLLVGDARDPAAYEQLMQGEVAELGIHDPPYNVRIQGNVGGRGRIKRREFACASGEMDSAEFIAFLKETLGPCAHNSVDGAIHFVFIDWRHVGELIAAGSEVFDDLKNMCVWVKSNAGQGSFYRSQHELVLVFKHGNGAHLNNFGLGAGGRTRSNVWRYAGVNSFRAGRMDELKMHPTVKPVAMIADAMRDCSRRGSIVLDAFAGSGTTIMAAEQIGRRAFCMEIDPRYADVAIRRWQAFTKRDALLESTGQTFDQLAKGKARVPAKSRRRA
jgi:DNA modification methylase